MNKNKTAFAVFFMICMIPISYLVVVSLQRQAITPEDKQQIIALRNMAKLTNLK